MSMIRRTRSSEGREAVWADTFKAMGDRTRLTILLKLIEAEVSFHLTRLKFAGLVVDERQGQRVIYRLNPELSKITNDAIVLDVECCVLKFPKTA